MNQSESTPENPVTVHAEQSFQTDNGKRMWYEPGSVVACPDAMYIVKPGGNWEKFAQLHRKKGWKVLKFSEDMLSMALAEMERQKAMREALEKSRLAEIGSDGCPPVEAVSTIHTEHDATREALAE